MLNLIKVIGILDGQMHVNWNGFSINRVFVVIIKKQKLTNPLMQSNVKSYAYQLSLLLVNRAKLAYCGYCS